MNLSIIITLLNDDAECRATIASLRSTAPPDLPIFVIDDCSEKPFVFDGDEYVVVVRNRERIGCAPSRHKGAEMAATSHVLLLDSHMRAENGWYQSLIRRINASPLTIFNGTCLGLAEGRMDLAKAQGEYSGARMRFFGIDKNKPAFKLVLQAQWHPHKDNEEVGALMGACYCVKRDTLLDYGGLQHLRLWGGDEQRMSLGFWLSGFEIRQAADVKFGHKFRDVAPYRTPTWEIQYNLLYIILTLLGDSPEAMFLIGKLKQITPAQDWAQMMAQMVRQQPLIVSEYEKNKVRFKHDLRWYCEKFGAAFPE